MWIASERTLVFLFRHMKGNCLTKCQRQCKGLLLRYVPEDAFRSTYLLSVIFFLVFFFFLVQSIITLRMVFVVEEIFVYEFLIGRISCIGEICFKEQYCQYCTLVRFTYVATVVFLAGSLFVRPSFHT